MSVHTNRNELAGLLNAIQASAYRRGKYDALCELFGNDETAEKILRKLLWPAGITCPFCHHLKAYITAGPNSKRAQWKCASCRKKFSLTTGTIIEGSHLPPGLWLRALLLIDTAPEAITAIKLQRELGITYKTAWHIRKRIHNSALLHEFSARFAELCQDTAPS